VQDARLDTNLLDYAVLVTYFMVVLGVGFAAKRYIRTSLDSFLSGTGSARSRRWCSWAL
jgi:solute:Na+ symporter, SSS family